MQIFIILASLLSLLPADWSESGKSGGWTYSDLGTPYTESGRPVAIKFSKGGASVASCAFTGAIVRIELDTTNSQSPIRVPALTGFADGKAVFGPASFTPDRACQAFDIARDLGVDRFQIVLGSGTYGNWGISAIRVTYLLPDEVRPPTGLRTGADRSHYVRASWSNPPEAVSNELRLISVSAVPLHANYTWRETFAAVTNATRSSSPLTAQLPALCPGLSGLNIYAPECSTNLIMIGKSKAHGVLHLDGPPSYRGLHLVITAHRFAGPDEGHVMPVSWIDGEATNLIASVTLADDFTDYAIDLAGVPDGATLALQSMNDRSAIANGRIIVAAIGYADTVVPAHAETNELRRVACRGERCVVTGLAPGTDGLWSVRSFDARSNASEFAPYEPFRTASGLRIGTRLSVR